jgi:drug/metabolite transporter (DMT)-like permease
MKIIKYGGASLFLCCGVIAMAIESHDGNTLALSTVKFAGLGIGATLLNRAITNKPLFPSRARSEEMFRKARKHWPLALLAIALYFGSLVIVVLGNPEHFGYSTAQPLLSKLATIVTAALASYLLWRYLKLVKFDDDSNLT